MEYREITPGMESWPQQAMDDLRSAWGGAPERLWVAGDVSALHRSTVAVVGSRAASEYGLTYARQFGYELARDGLVVVSGLAYGIDGAAHRGALMAGTVSTVAVLPCGIDVAHPSGHRSLACEITRHGCLVSAYEPGTVSSRERFLARNALIAALSGGTLVVEAGIRSGTMSTVRATRKMGRPVFAMPGPVGSVTSTQCHTLIRCGEAELVTCGAEVSASLVVRKADERRVSLIADLPSLNTTQTYIEGTP